MALTTTTDCLLITFALTLALANGLQQRTAGGHNHPPIIYTIRDDFQLISSHQKPHSWNNRQLTKQIPQDIEPEGRAIVPYHGNGPSQWDQPGDSPFSGVANQFGDLSLLYSHASSPTSNRWPASSRPRQGTKGSAKSWPPGTKSARRPPANKHHHHEQPAQFAPTLGASPTDTRNQTTTTSNRRTNSRRKNLVCYYGTWAVYRPDAGKYPVENIDPFLCTHIIYGFTGLSYDNIIKPLDPWNDLEDNYGKGAMKRFTNLKRINPDLKTLVAIGGWNEGSIKYSRMASEPEARARFVDSVVKFLAKYNFDGLDFDWEYPGSRGGASHDKQNFVKLLRELKQAFAPHGYLLTAAVSAGKWFIDPAYDIPQVSKYLDLINLMAYDYHGGWETKTGMNAPLFHSARHDLGKDEALLNVNWSVNYWLRQGAPREKIMLGVGSYGRSFTLDKAQVNGINAPASQKGQPGPYTREPGSLGYNEICEAFQRQPHAWTIVRDPDYLAPYAYNDRLWVGYDDQQSLALKAQYAKSMGLGGMMMWSIETDDFHGRCHNEKYPLLNTIRRVLDADSSGFVRPPAGSTTTTTTAKPALVGPTSSRRPNPHVTPTTPGREVEDEPVSSTVAYSTSSTTRRPRPSASSSTRRPPIGAGSATTSSRRPTAPPHRPITTSTTTTRPLPTSASQEFVCRADGMFADPNNCRKFIRCVSSAGSQRYSVFKFDCAPGTAFNEQQQYCDYIYNVPSCGGHTLRVAPPLSSHSATSANKGDIHTNQNLILWRQNYPGYFSHNFMVHHQWH